MTRAVCISGPGRGTPGGDSQLMALVSLALVRGYDPVVVALDTDACRMVAIMGGEFWAIEVPPPVVYVPEVAQAFAAWESEAPTGQVLRLRKSKLWSHWLDDIRNEITTPRRQHAERI